MNLSLSTVLCLQGNVSVAGRLQGCLSWAEPSTAPCQNRASSSCSKRDLPLPDMSHEWCWVCSGRSKLREETPLCDISWERRVSSGREAALQALRAVQEEGSYAGCYRLTWLGSSFVIYAILCGILSIVRFVKFSIILLQTLSLLHFYVFTHSKS